MSEKVSITFDEDNNIRILDVDKYRESDQLKSQAMEFITKVNPTSFRLLDQTKLSPLSPKLLTNLPSKSKEKNLDLSDNEINLNPKERIEKRK